MGQVKIAAKLTNYAQAFGAEEGYIPKSKVKSFYQEMLVDTGAVMVLLPQNVIDRLELKKAYQTRITYANNNIEDRWVYNGLKIEYGNRQALCDCVSLPDGTEALMGQIPLEEMDMVVDCRNQVLIPNPAHNSPNMPVLSAK